jgi:hypothetical protein
MWAEQITQGMLPLVHMLFVSLLTWWYGLGWMKLVQKINGWVKSALDFFSVGQLAGSLFAPYRQISVGRVQGTVGDELRAFGDQLFSRFFGALIRLTLIFAGLVVAAGVGILGLVLLAAWPLLPVLPFAAIFMMQVRAG